MKNIYEIEVRAQCPVQATDTDRYEFTIESASMIQVETITEFFATNAGTAEVFQEELTRLAAVTFGAKVRSIGWHSGVKVTCEAP